MVQTCSIPGCGNRFSKEIRRQFFRFPLKREDVLKLWLNAIGKKNFKPSKHSKICSDHFLESDYLLRPGASVKWLRYDAVPSLFPIRQKPRKYNYYLIDPTIVSKTENVSDFVNLEELPEKPSKECKEFELLNKQENSNYLMDAADIKVEDCFKIENFDESPEELPKEYGHLELLNKQEHSDYLWESIDIKEEPTLVSNIENLEESSEKLPEVCEQSEFILGPLS